MDDILDVLVRCNGAAHVATLREHGVGRAALREALEAGDIVRVRIGWYALPRAHPDVIAAIRGGGRITCISLLKLSGIWLIDDGRLHVCVPRDSHVRGGRSGTTRHYAADGQPVTKAVTDPLVWAFVHLASCQPRDNVIVSLDSALTMGLLSRDDLEVIRMLLPVMKRYYIDLVDGSCQSGLETKCRLALRARRIRYRTQARIPRVGHVDILIGDRLVIELDGIGYHTGEQVEKDRRRDLELHRQGYIVLRVSYSMLMFEWESVFSVILQYVERRAHRWPAGSHHGIG